MYGERFDMPWDGALPMLRHGPLQLQVIAFPVPPPLFSLSSSLLLSLAFYSSQSAGSLLPCAGPQAPIRSFSSSVLLPFVSCSLWLSLSSTGTSFVRWLWSSSSALDSTVRVRLRACVRECVLVCLCVRERLSGRVLVNVCG